MKPLSPKQTMKLSPTHLNLIQIQSKGDGSIFVYQTELLPPQLLWRDFFHDRYGEIVQRKLALMYVFSMHCQR